jgi:hypothetical protein
VTRRKLVNDLQLAISETDDIVWLKAAPAFICGSALLVPLRPRKAKCVVGFISVRAHWFELSKMATHLLCKMRGLTSILRQIVRTLLNSAKDRELLL